MNDSEDEFLEELISETFEKYGITPIDFSKYSLSAIRELAKQIPAPIFSMIIRNSSDETETAIIIANEILTKYFEFENLEIRNG